MSLSSLFYLLGVFHSSDGQLFSYGGNLRPPSLKVLLVCDRDQSNDESNVCVYDRDFSAQLAKIFADDLAACRRVTLEEWRGRGAMTKLRELVASLLRDQV